MLDRINTSVEYIYESFELLLMHNLNLFHLSEQRLVNLKMSSCVSSVHHIKK